MFFSLTTQDIGASLQRIGGEFGVTSGRARRCGWLDLVVVKYTNMINQYSAYVCMYYRWLVGVGFLFSGNLTHRLALTKMDILDSFEEIKVAVAYRSRTGDRVLLESFPADHNDLVNVDPVYETLPGWKSSLVDCRRFEDMPESARNYVLFVEKFLNVPGSLCIMYLFFSRM